MSLTPIKDETRGDLILRILPPKAGRYRGAVIRQAGGLVGTFEDADAEALWRRLEEEAARADKSFVGFDGARARFLHFFPDGFTDPRFARMEGNYKRGAKTNLDAVAPVTAVAEGSGYGEAALAAYRDTNLLHPVEKSRMADVLRGPRADAFLRATAAFALGAGAPALHAIREALHPHGAASWTAATYLPFLWRPDAHMFLKPEVTKDFAARVGHPFHHAYAPALEMKTYNALLDLTARTEAEIASLGPKDRVDVQSFIWVVGSYGEGEATP